MMSQRRRGASLSLLLLFINTIVGIAYLPLLLYFLDTSAYGMYELGAGLIFSFTLLDLGLSTTLCRYYSLWYTNEKQRIPSLLTTSLTLYAGLILIAFLLSFILANSVHLLFARNFSDEELSQVRQIILLVAVNSTFVLPTSWMNGLLMAVESFSFIRIIAIGRTLLQFVITLGLLVLTGDPVAALLSNVLLSALVLTATWIYTHRHSSLSFKFSGFNWKIARALIAFTFFISLIMIFDLVFWRSGQIVLGITAGTEAVAVYALSVRIITSIFMPLSTSISSVFLAHLTQISYQKNSTHLVNTLFIKVGRIQSMLVWVTIGGFAVSGDLVINSLLGSDFREVYWCTLVLMLGLSVSSTQTLSNQLLQAQNKLAFKSIVYTILFTIFALLAIPVANRFGPFGLSLLGSILLFVGTGPVLNYFYSTRIGIDTKRFFYNTLPIAGAAGFSVTCALLARWGMNDTNSIVTAFLSALIFLVAFIAFLYRLIFNEYERYILSLVCKKFQFQRSKGDKPALQ